MKTQQQHQQQLKVENVMFIWKAGTIRRAFQTV